jgi:hypothetical protein
VVIFDQNICEQKSQLTHFKWPESRIEHHNNSGTRCAIKKQNLQLLEEQQECIKGDQL